MAPESRGRSPGGGASSPAEAGTGFWQRSFPAILEPGLRRYLAGQIVSFIGVWAQHVALNLLLYEMTGSASLLGLLNFLLYAPMLLVAPIAGSRLSHRRIKGILLTALVSNSTVSAMLCWFAVSASTDLLLLLSLALVSGCLSAVELPARLVLITATLKNPALTTSALSLNALVNHSAKMIGAPIGAALFIAFGAQAAFALCTGAMLFMAACVASVTVVAQADGEQTGTGIREGLRYVRSEPFASFFLPVIALVGLFANSYSTLVPLLGGEAFGDAARYTGWFLSAAGVGAALASVVLASRFASSAIDRCLGISHWIACLGLAGIWISPTPILAGLAFFVLGASITFTNSASSAMLLLRCPREVRGSIAGLYSMAFAGMLPFGHLLAGALSGRYGPRPAFLVMSTGLVVGLIVLRSIHSRKHRL